MNSDQRNYDYEQEVIQSSAAERGPEQFPHSVSWALGVVPTSPLSPPSCASPLSTSSSTYTSAAWPASRSTGRIPLAAWDQREQAATDTFGHYQRRSSCPHTLLVIDLALALGPDLVHFLPAAHYDLSCYGPSKILSGTPAPPISLALPPSHPAYASHTCAARKPTLPSYLAAFISTHLHARAPAPLCAYLEDEPPMRHACRESFYFMLNVLRSVGGIACGRDADPLFTLLQAVEMLERTDFSDGTRCAGRAREVWGAVAGVVWA
ncbi:hypothetical protein B0H14DRAFT_3513497 [Mycena olivaceomarginata]|nr:hypothetical protein B0H14DRAFT_3513497 [Mycena olivaceomarginata]